VQINWEIIKLGASEQPTETLVDTETHGQNNAEVKTM
jgi:hypothetical protein